MMRQSDVGMVVEGVMVARCRVIGMACFEERERYRSIVGAGASSFDTIKTSRRGQTRSVRIGRAKGWTERSVRAKVCWMVCAVAEDAA
jgi:hypothetical protein